MNIILFDDYAWEELLPLTFTRPVSEIRIGILTIREKWEKIVSAKISFHTREHLQEKFPIHLENENLLINSCLLPDKEICELAISCPENMAYINEGRILIAKMGKNQTQEFLETLKNSCNTSEIKKMPSYLSNYCDIFSKNGEELEKDFKLITNGRKSQKASNTNQLIKAENIFIEEGAIIECSTLNATSGSIYIGKEAEIMEGSNIRGSFALCEHSAVKLGTKIYGPTTIGPYSKVGGEINNSVIFGYTNKAHDGFLGNSVIGEWCNIGADSNNSNLKNNYSNVKMWNYTRKQFANTGLLFAGLIMGDHSKCGINTMFNTGTVVGVSANLFGAGFHRNFIPSFSWGGPTGYTTNHLNKSLEVAKIVFSRRNIDLSEVDIKILAWIHEYTEKYRQMQSE
jgi:UDP-N-acetylglucosamine diphosphorylase/glucosamine-1-phosphate N-acetyltransferase